MISTLSRIFPLNNVAAFLLAFLFFVLSSSFSLASAHTLSGKISDNSSTPIPSTIVEVVDVGTQVTVGSATSDNAGDYAVQVNDGIYDIKVTPSSGSEFSPVIAFSRSIFSNTILDFILVPAGSVALSGHIYDSQGNPAPNIEIALRVNNGNTLVAGTNTDSSGFYSLTASPGNYGIRIVGSNTTPNLPQSFDIQIGPGAGSYTGSNYSLTQSTVLDFTIPAKRVSIKVQDPVGNPVSGVNLSTNIPYATPMDLPIGGGLTLRSVFTCIVPPPGPATDNAGNAVLWLLPKSYDITATPPSGSIYSSFILNNIIVSTNQTELVQLQYNHTAPVTKITLTNQVTDNVYSDPTNVMLSTTVADGYTVAHTYYKLDFDNIRHEYTAPFTVSGAGDHQITYWSVDNTGVQELPKLRGFTIISNQPPVADAKGPHTVEEGGIITLSGSATDPDNDVLTYKWNLDNDDIFEALGKNVTFSAAGKSGPSLQTVTLQVCDDKGACDTDSAEVNIANVSPSVETITASTVPTQINTSITASTSFTNPAEELDAPYTIEWNWGDGTIETANSGNEPGAISKDHTYTTAGVYEIALTVTDADGGVGTSTFQYIVIYNPDGGFVTGGGWITSPEGAYPADNTLTGKATFGFVSKYKKGANVPEGNTHFNFQVADFKFHSTSYDWLVIAGSKAQYKGTGTINGEGSYKFILTATDGSPDKIRLKVWNADTNTIMYDNQHGASDDSNPTTAIGGGSIVIHK